jgi:hypothetical protein
MRLYGNPNGIASHSPRLPYSATLGPMLRLTQPQRGCACQFEYEQPNVAVLGNEDRDATPSGLPSTTGDAFARRHPRVAEYGRLRIQLLWGRKPGANAWVTKTFFSNLLRCRR